MSHEIRPSIAVAPYATSLLVLFLASAAMSAEVAAERPAAAPAPIEWVLIGDLHRHVDEGRPVVLEGRVVGRSKERFFRLQDLTGKVMLVISRELQREFGTPAHNERIRVVGEFARNHLADERNIVDERDWGIRVRELERDVAARRRNPAYAHTPAPDGATQPSGERSGHRGLRAGVSPERIELQAAKANGE